MYGGLVGPGAELYRELARMDEAAHMPHSALSLAERLSGNLYAAGIDRDIQSIANRIAGVVPATIPGAHNRYIESIVNSAAALTRMAESPVLGAFNHYIDSFSASALAADRAASIWIRKPPSIFSKCLKEIAPYITFRRNFFGSFVFWIFQKHHL